MKIIRMKFSNALVFFVTVLLSQTSFGDDHNMLKDPGFEQDNGGWTLFDNSRISTDEARTGSHSVFSYGISRTIPAPPFLLGSASGSFQEFAAEPGSRWRLTGYSLAPARLRGVTAYGILQVTFFDDAGTDLGTVETAGSTVKAKISNQVNPNTPAGAWVFLDTGVVTAPANATKVNAFTLYVDFSSSGISQGVYFDDLSLCALDEGAETCD